MKKTKLFKPMWNLLLLLMAMLVPQRAWAIWEDSAGAKHIVNAADFANFSSNVNGGIITAVSGNFKLDNDITLPSDWVAIGTDNSGKRFTGTFDGEGHTITFSGSSQGLFGCTDGATIQNLKLAGSISSGQDNTGSVVSTARGATKIYNVYSSVGITMTAAKSHIGGIAGQILQADGKTGEIKGCTYSGEMNLGSSTDSNGGIVGYCGLNANIEIENCFFSGSISSTGGTPRIGGILGYADDDGSTQNFKYIRNCFCDGTLSPSTGDYVGIFAGYPRGKVKDVITNNTYVSTASTNMAGNSTHTTAENNGCKKITISVTAGGNGTVSKTYVNPTSTTATQLQVLATPDAHYHFGSWSDSGAQTHNVGLTNIVSLTASFSIDQHIITVNVASGQSSMGTVSGGGTYNYGTQQTIKATPKEHYHFVQWNDGDTNASRSITVTGDKTYTATFAIDQHTITVNVASGQSSMGTVSGGGTYNYGTQQTISAAPTTGYHFVKWSDNNTNASRTITVNGNATYTANFAAHTYGDWITDKAATCTTTGTKHRVCTHTGCGAREDGTIPALGHGTENYTPAYHWGGTHDAATCNYDLKCNKCSTNIVTNEALTTTKVAARHIDATCTEDGNETWSAAITYSNAANADYNGEEQTHDYAIPAHGHDYKVQLDSDDNPLFVWSDDSSTATLQVVCSHNAEHTAHVEVTGEGITSEVTTPATCTTAGVRTYTATAIYAEVEYTGTKDVVIPAHGHDYQVQLDSESNPLFVWSDDSSTATLQVVCSHNAEHTAHVEVTGEGITSEVTTPATCTTAGVRTYTATAIYAEVEYTGTKDVVIPAHGHDYQVQHDSDGNPLFVWSDDCSTATLQVVCSHNAEHTAHVEVTGDAITSAVTTAATCTTTGVLTYTATATYAEEAYAGTKDVVIPAHGHDYQVQLDSDGNPLFVWSDDCSTATLQVVCSHNAEHTAHVVVTGDAITSAVTAAATCTTTGVLTYTATAIYAEVEYTGTKDVVIPALGHDYQVQLDSESNPLFVWSDDCSTATLQVVCSHNAEHTAHVEVTGKGITSEVTTAATCTTTGVLTYTASATYAEVEYTGTKDVVIPAHGHDYQVQLDSDGNPLFVWSDDCSTATLQVVCSHNAEHTAHVEVTGDAITSAVTTAATCTTPGVLTYTASATYAEVEYTGTKDVVIPAHGHDYQVQLDSDGNPLFVWSDDCSTATLQVVCSHNAEHTAHVEVTGKGITSEVTTAATCTTTGVLTYTASATYAEEEYSGTKELVIQALGHVFSEETSLCDDGYHHHICQREECGAQSEDKYAKMFGVYHKVTGDDNPTATIKLSKVGSKYYTSLYTDFPYIVSGGLRDLYIVTSAANGNVELQEVSSRGYYPAHCGIIFKAYDDELTIHYNPSGFGQTITGSLLTGSETVITNPADNQYAFGLSNEGYLGFWHWPDMTIPAWKAYLDLGDEPSGARGFRLVFDDEPNGIRQLPADASAIEGCYDLMGHKVREVKGLGIVNGKKVYMK